jgi:hypothetical protein
MDELKKEMAGERVFLNMKEPVINFLPTYKYEPEFANNVSRFHDVNQHSDFSAHGNFDQKRIPAWCDRILYRSNNNCPDSIVNHKYDSIMGINISDHKPVYATYSINVVDMI